MAIAARSQFRAVLLAWLVALPALLALGWNAAPQEQLLRSRLAAAHPPPNALLADAPDRITLTFAEPIDAASATVRLLGAGARDIPLEAVTVPLDEGGTIAVRPLMVPGSDDYTVIWSAHAAADGALLAGAYPFRAGVIENPGAAGLQSEWPSPWATLLRWLVFLGTALAMGGFAWSPLLAPRHSAPQPPWHSAPMTLAALIALTATLLSPVAAWLVPPGQRVITFTGSLRAMPLGWWVQVVALLGLTLLCVWTLVNQQGAARVPTAATWSGLLIGCIALIGLSFTSHAAAARDAPRLALEIAHQWSTALWLSGLLYLALGWRDLGSDVDRFRTVRWIGGLLFALSVAIGLKLAQPLLSPLRSLVATPYGQVLASKGITVLIILILGLLALVVPRRASARVASGSFTAQGLIALVTGIFAAQLALLSPPGTNSTATLAGVNLADVVPLDISAFGTDSGIVHLMSQPVSMTAQTLVVRMTNDRGMPLVSDPVPKVEVALELLASSDAPEITLPMQPDATGALFTGTTTLPRDGWWQASVAIIPPGGIASRARFWLILPDPNLAGRGPETENDPAARSLFTQGLDSLTSLSSVRTTRRLNDGAGAFMRSRLETSAATADRPAAFSETVLNAAGDVMSRQRVIGERRWVLRREDGWIEGEPAPSATPVSWEAEYANATGFQLGPRQEVDGELCQIVTFWRPPAANPTRDAAWFAWWIGLASGEVRREAMISTRQYVVQSLRGFDASIDIVPPESAAAATPAATPRSGSTPIAATPLPRPR